MSNRGCSSNRRICSCVLLPRTRGEPGVDFTPRRPGGTRTTNDHPCATAAGPARQVQISHFPPPSWGGDRSAPGADLLGGWPVFDHLVNQPKVPALLRRHIGIAFEF